MQSVTTLSTVRVGNHSLTAAEQAAGVPQRLPFVDAAGDPVDPDQVVLWLQYEEEWRRSFAYPTAGPEDAGTLSKESTGRFYMDWTPDALEDGKWFWRLTGAMDLATSRTDEGVFYVKRSPVTLP